MKRLIATDFDGTFCRNGQIDPLDRKAVSEWRKHGNYFGFVTGRGIDFIEKVKELGIETDYLLLYNGALLTLADGTVLKEYLIPRSDFSQLVDFFGTLPDAKGLSELDDNDFFHHHYSSFDSPERALEVANKMNGLFGEKVTAFVNGCHVNIGKKGSSKAQGVFDALEYFSLPADAAAVFGDDFNDIEMIKTHGGWAVDTARPEILKTAPNVCRSVGEFIINSLNANPDTAAIKGLNPFLPFGTYIPDGEPKVFGNRMYLYGSFDIFGEGYCSKCYHTFSAPLDDLTNWTDHGVSFESRNVTWSDALLYAPDALYHNGRYYLFFCMSDGSEGVAESNTPEGPFENAKRITLDGEPVTGIDPSVFEEDGRIYYTWGQFHLNMGELNEDMQSLKKESVHTDVLSNSPGREGFHEGSSLRKLGKYYCIIYASEYTPFYPNRGGKPTKLDYAVSENPYGPYERRGTVIDNEGCDPASWNNHGSIIKANGEWFVFYHSSSNNSAFSRRARAERLKVNEGNGLIEQAKPSTNGFVKTLLPENIVSPINAARFLNGAYVTRKKDGLHAAVIFNNSGFVFSPVKFKEGSYTLSIEYTAGADVTLSVHLGKRKIIEKTLRKSEKTAKISFPFTAKNEISPLMTEVFGENVQSRLCEIYKFKIS
ncbi:MAG: family 43 glycosylhydrolase [Clostridia bacterium]|nr:family 43 glycosylhydrolase [Clostridia bacterium]